eukprot:5811207-Amphidinium_carterae.1
MAKAGFEKETTEPSWASRHAKEDSCDRICNCVALTIINEACNLMRKTQVRCFLAVSQHP